MCFFVFFFFFSLTLSFSPLCYVFVIVFSSSVWNDVKSLLFRRDDPVHVLFHVRARVLSPFRPVFCWFHALDLSLVRVLCSDRHNTYTVHVSPLSHYNVYIFIPLFFFESLYYKNFSQPFHNVWRKKSMLKKKKKSRVKSNVQRTSHYIGVVCDV